nr:uncharacterized protein LOC115841620 isoform X3 [Globicephala melas]
MSWEQRTLLAYVRGTVVSPLRVEAHGTLTVKELTRRFYYRLEFVSSTKKNNLRASWKRTLPANPSRFSRGASSSRKPFSDPCKE